MTGILTRSSTDFCSHWSMTMDWMIVEPTLEQKLTLEFYEKRITSLEESLEKMRNGG